MKKDLTSLKEQIANLRILFDNAVLNEQSMIEVKALYLQIKDLEAFYLQRKKYNPAGADKVN